MVSNTVPRGHLGFWTKAVLSVSLAISPTTLVAQEAPDGPIVIDSIAVRGNLRQTDQTIVASGTLNPGSAYTIFDIQKATKSL